MNTPANMVIHTGRTGEWSLFFSVPSPWIRVLGATDITVSLSASPDEAGELFVSKSNISTTGHNRP